MVVANDRRRDGDGFRRRHRCRPAIRTPAAESAAFVKQDFGTRLVAAREHRDYTAGHLVRLTGIEQAQISHYECGHREPSADNIRKLALALDITADYLLGLSDETRRIRRE